MEDSPLGSYNNCDLFQEEVEVLEQLEAIIGDPLPNDQSEEFWFVAKNNHVTTLWLSWAWYHSRTQLTTLPETIGRLTDLKYLCLLNNNLKALPESVGHLSILNTLDLSSNHLVSLPHTIGNLTSLMKLDSSSNQITFLPDSLGNLTNLQKLNLSHNQLEYIPTTIGNLSKLSELNIATNILNLLPDSLGNLNHLKKLDLAQNKVRTLPKSFDRLKNLEIIKLRNNLLSNIPPLIGKLDLLRIIDLSNNRLSELPEEIGNLSNLEELAIEENQLSTLPGSLGNLKSLKILLLSNNKLKTLPTSLGKLSDLRYLFLSGNPLLFLPESLRNLTNLKEFRLVRGGIWKLSLAAKKQLKHLTDVERTESLLRTLEKETHSVSHISAILKFLKDERKITIADHLEKGHAAVYVRTWVNGGSIRFKRSHLQEYVEKDRYILFHAHNSDSELREPVIGSVEKKGFYIASAKEIWDSKVDQKGDEFILELSQILQFKYANWDDEFPFENREKPC